MQLEGKVVKIFPKNQVSDKFAKREFVIETNDQYPQKVICQMTQERCETLDNVGVGENVTAFINVKGREWTNPQGEVKYFNTIECWKLVNESTENFKPDTSKFEEELADPSDDLPF